LNPSDALESFATNCARDLFVGAGPETGGPWFSR